jgi:hypothetical protein
MNALRPVLTSLLLAASCGLSAQDYAPGSTVTVEGRVARITDGRSFYLAEANGRQLLVYVKREHPAVRVGQRLKIEGRVSDDFIKLAQIEIDARAIESAKPL